MQKPFKAHLTYLSHKPYFSFLGPRGNESAAISKPITVPVIFIPKVLVATSHGATAIPKPRIKFKYLPNRTTSPIHITETTPVIAPPKWKI